MSEQIYPLQLNPDYYVVTANDLIKGKQKMTLREAQLLYITMSQVVKEDKDFKTYSIAVSELASFMGIGPNALYRDLENICTSLLKRVVKIYVQDANNPSERKWKAFQWISAAEYENGKLTIKLNDELKPFLIELVSHYSQILLGTLCSFNSYYAARLYQYIVCEIGEHPRNPKEKNEYARNYDLVRKTIKVALDELNKSDFTYIWDYEELRGPGKGRPLVGVKFKAAIFKDKDEKDWYLEKVHPLYQSQFEPKSEQLTLK